MAEAGIIFILVSYLAVQVQTVHTNRHFPGFPNQTDNGDTLTHQQTAVTGHGCSIAEKYTGCPELAKKKGFFRRQAHNTRNQNSLPAGAVCSGPHCVGGAALDLLALFW